MKRIAVLATLMLLLLCSSAFAASNLEKLNGSWQCNAEATMEALGEELSGEDPMTVAMISMMLSSFQFEFDAKAKNMTAMMGPESESGAFAVVSDKGTSIHIKDFNDVEMVLEFFDNDNMGMTDPVEEAAPIIFTRIK